MTENQLIYIFVYSFVQGFTEFIPISSSGHLNLVDKFIMASESRNLLFETTAHFSTLLALCLFLFKNSSGNFKKKILGNLKPLFIATIPALIVGFFIKLFNYNYVSLQTIAFSSIIGAILLFASSYSKNIKIKSKSKNFDFLIAGLFQCLAFIPGFSRSGACITAFLLLGKSKSDSIYFSLLMSLPIILISFLSNYKELIKFEFSLDLFLIFIICFFVAYITLKLFIKYINKIGFLPYIVYRIILGFIILALLV